VCLICKLTVKLLNSTANSSSSKMLFFLLTAVQFTRRILKVVPIIQDNKICKYIQPKYTLILQINSATRFGY
jgi:hypothetical protein